MPNYKDAFAFAAEDGHTAAAASVNPKHNRGVSIVMEGMPSTKPKATPAADHEDLEEEIAMQSAV